MIMSYTFKDITKSRIDEFHNNCRRDWDISNLHHRMAVKRMAVIFKQRILISDSGTFSFTYNEVDKIVSFCEHDTLNQPTEIGIVKFGFERLVKYYDNKGFTIFYNIDRHGTEYHYIGSIHKHSLNSKTVRLFKRSIKFIIKQLKRI